MMLFGKERSAVFRQVFSNLNTKTSSDLVVALHDIGKHSNIEMMIKINPVYCLEHLNWQLDSDMNILYIQEIFDNLSSFDKKEVKVSYNYIYRLFLDDVDINYIFPFTDDNVLTSKIFKELTLKRDYCNFN